jgi:hypothetical protein
MNENASETAAAHPRRKLRGIRLKIKLRAATPP